MKHLALVLALLVTPLLAQHPHTSRKDPRRLPLPKEEGVFHFVVFGDRTGGPAAGIEVLRKAVADTNLLGPDLVLTVGDLVEGYNSTDRWLQQMREFKGVMEGLHCPWFPVAGNHDVYWRPNPDRTEKKPAGENEASYEKHFGPLWYWFEHKNAAFFVLYTDEGDPKDGSKGFGEPRHTQMSEAQLRWLERELQKVRGKDHVFLFCHHPRWIEGAYKGTNWNAVHEILKKAGNVTAVFGGHIHRMHYAGRRDGIEYMALATTGGHKGVDLPGGGYVHHFNVVTVRKERVTYATIPVGAVLDPKMMTTEHLTAVDRLRNQTPRSQSGPLAIDRKGGSLGVYTATISNPTERPADFTALLEAEGDLWAFGPDHVHGRLKPGESRELELAYGRESRGFLHFTRPRVSLQIDYLSEGLRISLPAVVRELSLALQEVPPGFFDPLDHGALVLPGRSAYLELSASALKLPDGAMTVEAWFEARDLRGRRALVAKTEQCEFGVFVGDGQPMFDLHLDGKYVSVRGERSQLRTGRWHHVAGVFDGEELRLYVDGALVRSQAGRGARTRRPNPLMIGADPDRRNRPTSFFQGRIDEVRISKTARYQGPRISPARRHRPDDETVLLLHLDKDLGPFAPDHSPANAHPLRVGTARCVRTAKDPKHL